MINSIDLNKLFSIFNEVDGSCSVCVRNAYTSFIELFPQYYEQADEALKAYSIKRGFEYRQLERSDND